MKKLIIGLLVVSVFSLHAGHGQSKSSKKSEELSSLCNPGDESSSTAKLPFDGKQWKKVHIAPDHSIYTFDGHVITTWDFDGAHGTPCKDKDGYLKDATAFFTNKHCYLKSGSTIDQYSMESHTFEKRILMKKAITGIIANETGFATVTADNCITRFDVKGNPCESPIKLASSGCAGLFLLDPSLPGELYYGADNTLYKIEEGSATKLVKLPEICRFVCKKKASDQIITVTEHSTVKNLYSAILVSAASGKITSSFKISPYPNTVDTDGTTFVIGGAGNGGSAIKLYDLETGEETYKTTAKNICGAIGSQLEDKKLYLVGSKPEPRSMIIDTREKAH